MADDRQNRVAAWPVGTQSDSLVAEISSEELVEGIVGYAALSWEWGSEKPNEIIRIKNKNDDKSKISSLMLKPNLLKALQRLRKSDEVVRLWVDALCINQARDDNQEKSEQIAMVTKIYGMAEQVCVWLGEERDESTKAIEYIHQLVQLEDDNHIAALENNNIFNASRLVPLTKFLKRGWFSRRWVVQEISMARGATVYCGAHKVDWKILADAIALLEKVGRDGSINRILKRLSVTKHAPEYIGNVSSLPAYRLVQNTTGIFRGQDKRVIRTWRYTLEELVSFLAAFQASRLHDTIYAVLGLASDVEPVHNKDPKQGIFRAGTKIATVRLSKNFEVNYNTPPLVVFKDFLKHAITKSGSLDIICRPWAPTSGLDADGNPQVIKLPSWIPDLCRKPFRATKQLNMVRYNPDPLVGPSTFRHKFYCASGTEKAECDFRDFEYPHSLIMGVKGFQLGKIGEIWDSGQFGNIPARWLTAGGWENESEPPPDELWRTLVADRNSQGDDPEGWYPMVFQSAAKERGIHYGFETQRLINEGTNVAVAELFRRVQAVVWNRKLIRVRGNFMLWLAGKGEKSKREGEVEDGEHDTEPDTEHDTEQDEEQEMEQEETKAGDSNRELGRALNGVQIGERRHNGDVHDEKIDEAKEAEVRRQEKGVQEEVEEKEEEAAALGLAPNDVQKNDLVCIVYGCSVPLILRPSGPNGTQTNGTSSFGSTSTEFEDTQTSDETYTLIGECYIDHMMDGEAMAYFESRRLTARRFKLV